MMASRLIFLTFMCGILFAQESTEDSSVDDYTAAEKEVFESIKKESDKKERKSRRKMVTRDVKVKRPRDDQDPHHVYNKCTVGKVL